MRKSAQHFSGLSDRTGSQDGLEPISPLSPKTDARKGPSRMRMLLLFIKGLAHTRSRQRGTVHSSFTTGLFSFLHHWLYYLLSFSICYLPATVVLPTFLLGYQIGILPCPTELLLSLPKRLLLRSSQFPKQQLHTTRPRSLESLILLSSLL